LADVMCNKARADNKGNPTTTPNDTTNNAGNISRQGLGWRNRTNIDRPSTPAILARAMVRNTGSKSITATRVAGSDPANISTPKKPFHHPRVVVSIAYSMNARCNIVHRVGHDNTALSCHAPHCAYGY